jgi:hypothetical protein
VPNTGINYDWPFRRVLLRPPVRMCKHDNGFGQSRAPAEHGRPPKAGGRPGGDLLEPLCSCVWPPENFANNEENAVSDLPRRPEGRP